MARRSTASFGIERRRAMDLAAEAELGIFVGAHDARTSPRAALASTSCVLLPMDETMPIPVTTTRLMFASSASTASAARLTGQRSRACVLHPAEQADLEIERTIDHRAVRRKPAVGDAEHELGAHHALDVDAVDDVLHRSAAPGRENLISPMPERAAPAGRAEPAEKEAEQLPERVEAEAAGHHRIALEVAREEPQVRLEFEHRAHQALAVFAAHLRDLGDAVEHQHRRQRQLRPLRRTARRARRRADLRNRSSNAGPAFLSRHLPCRRGYP